MEELIIKPVFTDSDPHVFFRGEYVFRTLNGVLAVMASLLTSLAFAALAVYVPNMRDELLLNAVRGGFVLGAIAFGALSIRVLWGWILNHRADVEINEQGIISGKRVWPWPQVRSIYGTRYGNGVSLGLIPRNTMIVWGAGDLPTTPLLTEQQYLELVRELSQYLSRWFPHVDVAMWPLEPVGD